MKSLVGMILFTGSMVLLLVGCGPGDEYYRAGAPPAPPPSVYNGYYEQPALARTARENGSRDGYADGVRDRDSGHSFRPGSDDKYEDCPGYYDAMAPRDAYKRYYRDAYQHGYRRGYSRD